MGSFLITLIAGVVAGALTARQVVRHELQDLRDQLNRRGEEPNAPPAPPSENIRTKPSTVKPAESALAVPVPEVSDEITPEILTVLTAAVAAFLGKKARIRKARIVPVASGNAWAQQGRVFVQASHNLPHRG